MIPPLRPKEQYDFMKSKEEPSCILSNMISQKDLKYIYDVWKNTHEEREFVAGRTGKTKDHKKNKGNVRFPYEWSEFSHILEPIVDEILKSKKWKLISGRLYWVPEGRVWSTIHTDNWNYLDKNFPDGPPTNNGPKLINWLQEGKCKIYVPRKTIIMPLWIKGAASTVLFNQYNYGVESCGWRKFKHRKEFPGAYVDYTEYLEPLDRDSINEEDYNKYLQHIPKEELRGLSVQNAYDWEVGDIVVWDSTQLHVSGYQPETTEKVGITIWTAYS